MSCPFVDYTVINTRQELEALQAKIEGGFRIYGESQHTKSPICDDDALMVVFDDNGTKLELNFENYITPHGDKYRLNKNNKKIFECANKGKKYGIILTDNSTKYFPSHHLQLWSYYPDLDWGAFCRNRKTNATVDHILQSHERCHYKYLEAIPKCENSRRYIFSNQGDCARQKLSKTLGKPFNIFVDGVQEEGEFYTESSGIKHLKDTYGIVLCNGLIRSRLIETTVNPLKKNGKSLMFKYTEAYVLSQNDLPNETWYYPEDWKQKDEIIRRYSKIKSGKPPKAISDKGRVINDSGRKITGARDHAKLSKYNSVRIHTLVWLAFSEEPIEEKQVIRHTDNHQSNIFDDNGTVTSYSNWFETLSLGTQKDNMDDRGKETHRKAKLDANNEFIVFDNNGREVLRSFYMPECLTSLSKLYPDLNLSWVSIKGCLEKKRTHHLHFTFKYVVPR